ncbi:hypothetical protein AcV5_001247 [Taiwanofungus camphoratus]|nr:hypothetical protein AcV5_001247 [Antrodia cinnamomea]
MSSYRAFAQLLQSSPHVGSYVQELHLLYHPCAPDNYILSSIADGLGAVKKFFLQAPTVDVHIDPAIFSKFGPVTDLWVYATFSTLTDVVSLFRAFPKLSYVQLEQIKCSKTESATVSSLPFPVLSLKQLHMGWCDTRVLRMLLQPLPLRHLVSLHFVMWRTGNAEDDAGIIMLSECFARWSVLQNVHFQASHSILWIASLLSVAPLRLQEIIVEGVVQSTSEVELLADVLADARFQDVQKVALKLFPPSLTSTVDLSPCALQTLFSSLHARGVLSVMHYLTEKDPR